MQKTIFAFAFFVMLVSAVTLGVPGAHAQTATPTDSTIITTVAPTDSTAATDTPTATTLPNTAGANPTLLTIGLGGLMILIGSYSFFILKKK